MNVTGVNEYCRSVAMEEGWVNGNVEGGKRVCMSWVVKRAKSLCGEEEKLLGLVVVIEGES